MACLSRKNFSKRKSEKRGTWWLGNSPAAAARASCAPTPAQPHGAPMVAPKALHSYPKSIPSHPSSGGQVLMPTAPGGNIPDPAAQRHHALNPCAPGEAAEEAQWHSCATGPTGCLRGRRRWPCRGELQGSGSQQSPERLTVFFRTIRCTRS